MTLLDLNLVAPLTGALVAAAAILPASAAALDAYRWKARPVIVFAPPGADDAETQLTRLRAAQATLEERDMPVLVVRAGAVTSPDGAGATQPMSAAELRKAYGVGDAAFAIVLIGKDGGEKLRSSRPISVDRLKELVDQMPMRHREAR